MKAARTCSLCHCKPKYGCLLAAAVSWLALWTFLDRHDSLLLENTIFCASASTVQASRAGKTSKEAPGESTAEVLPPYGGDSEDVTRFWVDPTQVKGDKRFPVWLPLSGNSFFDCPKEIMDRYNETREPPASSSFLAQEGEDRYLMTHFFHGTKGRSDMRFIELGALDGMQYSNSYYFEKELGWGGVLIEGETANYKKLEENRQGSDVQTLHLGICRTPRILQIRGTGAMAAESGRPNGGLQTWRQSSVACLPMHEVLAMTGITHVDLYSIDVEGAELDVITSHNFKAVPAHVILIEMRPLDENREGKTGNAKIRRALWSRGFCRYANVIGHNNEVWVDPEWKRT